MKQNLSLKKLIREAKKASEHHGEIIDVVLYGSTSRGKPSPRDIDVLVIVTKPIDRSILNEYSPTILSYRDFLERFPNESILHEGFSLLFGKPIAELYHLASFFLFRYDLRGKSPSQRMGFYYALYGRNGPGVLQRTKSKKFSSETLLTPTENSDVVREFLEFQKVEYFSLPILFPVSYKDAEKLSGGGE